MPLWFRRRLGKIDKRLVLQYLPPRSLREPRGVNPEVYPNGVWDVCRKIKGGRLHPVAVWSLADDQGNYAPPRMDTIRLLHRAYGYHRMNRMDKMYRMLEDALEECRLAKIARSKERMMVAMDRYLKVFGERQFQNRVFMRREVPKEAAC